MDIMKELMDKYNLDDPAGARLRVSSVRVTSKSCTTTLWRVVYPQRLMR